MKKLTLLLALGVIISGIIGCTPEAKTDPAPPTGTTGGAEKPAGPNDKTSNE